MRIPRISHRRTGPIVAAAGVLAGAMIAVPAAHAATAQHKVPAPLPSLGSGQHQAKVAGQASRLADSLGAKSVGSYLDSSTGAMVVTVTSKSAARTVTAHGLHAKIVPHSRAQLRHARTELAHSASVPGTAWAVDPATDSVQVIADSTVHGAKLAKVRHAVDRLGSLAHLSRTAGTFKPKILGGDAIYGGQYRCSLGFTVHLGGTYYFLTAGHCGNIANDWYSDLNHTHHIGTTAVSSFPGNDYAIVQYDAGVSHPSAVDLYNGSSQPITSYGNAYVGEHVTRSGSTSGVHSGTVEATGTTVNYAEGTVSGLIETNVCAEGGDSGGSLFDGSTAIGLTSGGSGNCSSGGTTFFQPVSEPMNAYGLSIG